METDLLAYVKKKLDNKLKTRPESLAQYKGTDVHAFSDKDYWYVVMVSEDEVLYIVKYKKMLIGGPLYGRQVMIHCIVDEERTVGFAEHVFFNILLPKYYLVSDQLSTAYGAAFWKGVCHQALTGGLNVYLYDRLASPNTLTLLPTLEQFTADTASLWGGAGRGLRRFLVVSSKTIFLRIK